MPIPSRQITSAISGHKKKIESKQALKRAREMVKRMDERDAKKPKAKPIPKKPLKKATEAGGTALEEGRRMGVYKKAKSKKKKKTTSAGTWNKGRWYNTYSG